MTYGDKIRSMNDKQLAAFLSQCIIPEDVCEAMTIFDVGRFDTQDDLEDKLGEEVEPNDSKSSQR